MKRPFREHHIITILEEYDNQTLPLDLFVSNYFRTHKSLGSKDRAFISETAFSMIRWRALLDYATKDGSWEKRLDFFLNAEHFDALQNDLTIPDHIRLSFPKVLFEAIVRSHGLDQACQICSISNKGAPITIRANLLKITRNELLERLQAQQYLVVPCNKSSAGIIFGKRVNFYELPEFKEGLFEVQDEGSQLIADFIEAAPGQLVLDYCAGAAGKTLAFAHRMQNSGQIFLHDVRKKALLDGRKRLKRAGIQNAQIIYSEDTLKKLKKKMDWVLVDVPCSGSGTLRRNPDIKWKYSQEMLDRLVGLQRLVFERALSFLKPGGRIVYATCSLLKEENEAQIAHFQQNYQLVLDRDPFHSLPEPNGMDGFFAAVMKR